jgi:hypothetical protein
LYINNKAVRIVEGNEFVLYRPTEIKHHSAVVGRPPKSDVADFRRLRSRR